MHLSMPFCAIKSSPTFKKTKKTFFTKVLTKSARGARWAANPHKHWAGGDQVGAEGGSRTHTPVKATDFKSVVSTIPPLRLFTLNIVLFYVSV